MNKLKSVFAWIANLNQLTSTVVWVVVVASIMFFVGNCNGASALDDYIVKYDAFKDSSAAVLEQSKAVTAELRILQDSIDKTTTKIATLNATAQRRKIRIDSLIAQTDSLKAVLPLATTSQDTIATQAAIIASQDTVITNQHELLITKDATIAGHLVRYEQLNTKYIKSESDRLDLQSQLSKLPDAPPNTDRWFFDMFKKPTRVQVGVTAGALGILAGIYLGAK